MPRKQNEPSCFSCAGGPDCDSCQQGPKNSVPVKLYTPKGAARAMLGGRVLKGEHGIEKARWDKHRSAFVYERDGADFLLTDFSGLYEETT